MNFRDDLAAAVMAGTKTATRRIVSDNPRSPWWREKCAYRVGQQVAICPGRGKHQIGKATVTSVERMRLGHLADAEAHAEGFICVLAFQEAWTAINGVYVSGEIVWRIGLQAVRDA